LGIAEDRQGVLELGQVGGAQQYCCLAAVSRDHDAVVFALDAIDDFGKMVSDAAKRFRSHATIVALILRAVNSPDERGTVDPTASRIVSPDISRTRQF
jgi:hypothetical protein